MKILIGNHVDPAIRNRGDLRAWTQRVLWFADEGDVVILSHQPDQQFLHYATAFTGVDPRRLHVLTAPEGRFQGLLLDPESLTDPAFLSAVRAAADVDQIENIFALWPSASVARFADALGLTARLSGAAFFGQSGGELCNNKAVFRAIAAAAGVPIPVGAVCHSREQAIAASAALLGRTGAIVVKQAHNGAGMGNQLLISDASLTVDHVGARHLHLLPDATPEALSSYWDDRWGWASADGRFPVVIEEFVDGADTIYSEHLADDRGTAPTETGSLHYVDRRLSYQVVPLRDVSPDIRRQLLAGGSLLADAYRSLGYRGYLSADAIATSDGRVLFTEVNAQVSGSLHIYKIIAHGVVRVASQPNRSVVEYHVPPTWAVADFGTFMSALDDLGCAYDPGARTGVIVSMPIIPLVQNLAQFVFCIAYATNQDREEIYRRLDERFASVAPGTYRTSDRVGVPNTIPA